MIYEVKIPDYGDGVEKVVLLKWLKNVGDRVEKDETIVELESDKANYTIEAEAEGYITELIAKEGDLIPELSVICTIRPL